MKVKLIHLLIAITVLALAACSFSKPKLVFRAHLAVNSDGQTVTSMEVYNAGEATFRGHGDFDGVMQIRDEAGDLRVCAEAPQLAGSLEPDESHFPVGWKGDLAAGTYQLTWGAPKHGAVVVAFAIVERNGRLYLDQESLQTSHTEDFAGEKGCGEAQPLIDKAKADLAKQMEASLDDITTQSVEASEVVDGLYEITLMLRGKEYKYHGKEGEVLFVPEPLPPE